jgi:hypothetical protein
MIIRLDQHAETLEHLISGLEDGSRTLSSLATAQLLKSLNQAIKDCNSPNDSPSEAPTKLQNSGIS